MIRRDQRHRNRHPRAGYLYVGVLTTALIVGLIGVSAMSVARVKFDAAQRQSHLSSAQALARSAIEDAVIQINADASWRTNLTSGVEYPDPAHNLAGGSYTWSIVDSDGDLTDDDADAVWLTGTGQVGDAVFVETVMLQPTGAALSCLEASFHCGNSVTLGSAADLDTNQVFSSNGSIDARAALAKIDGNAEAVGTIQGAVTGTTTEGITPRRMPSESVFDYYLRNGTWIDFDSLDNGGGGKRIRDAVISPKLNPFGTATNVEGIYVIDCQNQQLTIMNTRVLGTLVLVNSSASTFIDESQYWSPAVLNYPTLLVEGNVTFRYTQSDLDEDDRGTNFNPVGAPYEGNEDTDELDIYPSKIKGLVYVSGTLKFPILTGDSLIDGSVVCGSLDARSDATFQYRATFLNYPPPGFASGNPMRIAPGTWHRTSR